MRRAAWLILAGSALITIGAVAAACGSLQVAPSQTPEAGSTPAPTSTFTLLQSINARLAAHGDATLPPGTDPSQGFPVNKTVAASVDATEAALPSAGPGQLFCGPAAARAGDIVTQYGPVTTNCAQYGDDWIVTTAGDHVNNITGVLALYRCSPNDVQCKQRGEPSVPGSWAVYPSPIGEGVRIFAQRGNRLLILPGEYCFDLATAAWVDPCEWDPTTTPVPEATATAPPAPVATGTQP